MVFDFVVMEEQFVLRVPPSVAERLDRLLSENASSDDKSLDLSFEGQRKYTCCIECIFVVVFSSKLLFIQGKKTKPSNKRKMLSFGVVLLMRGNGI